MSAEIRPGIRRLLRFITPRSTARDADDEIRLHLKLRTEQLIAEGMSPAAAREEAERRFGESRPSDASFATRRGVVSDALYAVTGSTVRSPIFDMRSALFVETPASPRSRSPSSHLASEPARRSSAW